MQINPYPIFNDKCGASLPVEHYHKTRVFIGPDTRMITLQVGRNTPFSSVDDLSLTLVTEDFEIPVSSYKEGSAFFVFPSCIPMPKGLIQADIQLNGCSIGCIELAIAPSYHVRSAKAVNSTCATSGWVEPDQCATPPCKKPIPFDAGCPTCNTDTPCVDEPIEKGITCREGFGG